MLKLSTEHVAAKLGVNSWLIDAAIRNGRLAGTIEEHGVYTTHRNVTVWLGNSTQRGC